MNFQMIFRFPIRSSSVLFKRFCSSLTSLPVKQILVEKPIDKKLLVQGWVQNIRRYKDIYFVDLVDGTCSGRLQIVIPAQNDESSPNYGSSIKVKGSLIKSSHKGQEVELVADSWEMLGFCDKDFPFVNHTKYTSEQIRQYPQLRGKTRRFSSILRIRNSATMAIHKFFQDKYCTLIHTPVITQNDCEGAGEVFSVEVKHNSEDIPDKQNTSPINVITDPEEESIEDDSEVALQHFFGAPVYLTVSGQFHLEAILASGFAGVYNFGPAFRAESSRTRLHACEFQMIEAEIAFITSVEDLCKVAEDCIKQVVHSLMENCAKEIQFVTQDLKNHDLYINNLLSKSFIQMPYEESISILEKSKDPIKFGEDLNAKHKAYLMKHCKGIPVFVTRFPSAIKPFYMLSDQDKAHCFDLFASYGGEICGGSLRENNYNTLKTKHPFEENKLEWYSELRKYGCPPHGGFGIGFERLLQSILGITNIRDIIPFPRRKYDCKC